MIKVKVHWDTDYDGRVWTLEEANLPEQVIVPEWLEKQLQGYGDWVEDDQWRHDICGWLTDDYGWLVCGVELVSDEPSGYKGTFD